MLAAVEMVSVSMVSNLSPVTACHAGYTGKLCNVSTDDYVGVNCCEHGQCHDGQNAYYCVLCDAGFTGEY